MQRGQKRDQTQKTWESSILHKINYNMANLVTEQIVREHLASLTHEQIMEILPKNGETYSRLVPGDPKPSGNVREVHLPSINAEADFDEIMESFVHIHILTEIR